MIDTNLVTDLIRENGSMSFNDIWTKISPQIKEHFDKIEDESVLKSNVYLSMIENFNLIMIGNNVWDLKDKYTNSEIDKIKLNLFGNYSSDANANADENAMPEADREDTFDLEHQDELNDMETFEEETDDSFE